MVSSGLGSSNGIASFSNSRKVNKSKKRLVRKHPRSGVMNVKVKGPVFRFDYSKHRRRQ